MRVGYNRNYTRLNDFLTAPTIIYTFIIVYTRSCNKKTAGLENSGTVSSYSGDQSHRIITPVVGRYLLYNIMYLEPT